MGKRLQGAGAMLLILAAAEPARGLTLTPTNIDFPGAYVTTATGINDRGDIVGQWYTLAGPDQGFVYRRGMFADIAVPGAEGALPQSINDRGQVAGYYFSASGPRGFVQ